MILSAKSLTLSKNGRSILNRVDLEISEGEIIGLIGPNGSGKSSFLKALSGILPFDSGTITHRGTKIDSFDFKSRSQIVTYVGSEFDSDFPITALEGVKLGDYPKAFEMNTGSADSKIESVMREFGCWDYRHRKIHSLSSGERQRVALARAFYQSPKVILLDESLSQLDLHHQMRVGEILEKHSKTGMSFVLVSHDLNFTIQRARRIVLLRNGEVLADGASAEVLNEKNLKDLYPDAEVDFSNHPKTGARLVYFRSVSSGT